MSGGWIIDTIVRAWTENGALEQAAVIIRNGGVVAFPTETVYGLGADAFNPAAVQCIFDAKRRPADNPLIVHVARSDDVARAVSAVPDAAARLMDVFWPGALTLILPARPCVPRNVTAGLDSVAVRMPAHPCAQELIRRAGTLIAAPSANASGRPSPTAAAHVLEDLGGRIPLILDGGPCEGGIESTVLDARGEEPVLLRPGLVTPEDIERVTGRRVYIGEGVMERLPDGAAARSPGLLHRHYAPNARLIIVGGGASAVKAAYGRLEGRTLILAADESLHNYQGYDAWGMGERGEPNSIAHNLFALLREADARGYDNILFEAQPADGVGLAVMNRALRAAGFETINAGP